jgi:hypothetical protein
MCFEQKKRKEHFTLFGHMIENRQQFLNILEWAF